MGATALKVHKQKGDFHMKFVKASMLVMVLFLTFGAALCDPPRPAESASGVAKATAKVPTDSNGNTIEQTNIIARYKADNTPGAIKHLYIISPYSGQVILYSTVKGKVTSGGKRLTPSAVLATNQSGTNYGGFLVDFGANTQTTTEVLGDDGTYGTSGDYLYWWDSKGIYHQHYLTGGQIVHISSEPIQVKSVILNVEGSNGTGQ